MKKLSLLYLAFLLWGSITLAEEHDISLGDQRIQKRYLAFKNISDYWITIITLDNRRITLKPNDYAWNGFLIGWEPVNIVAEIAPGVYIHDTFSRESDDECKWIIQVFKPIRKIVIRRLKDQDL